MSLVLGRLKVKKVKIEMDAGNVLKRVEMQSKPLYNPPMKSYKVKNKLKTSKRF